MKKCPNCKQTYADDTQSFCLQDGTLLVFSNEEETKVVTSPKRKGNRILLLLVSIGLLFFAGFGLIAVYLLNSYSRQTDNTRNNQQANANVRTKPINKSTPVPESTADSIVSETNKVESEKKPDNIDSEEATPITWETTTGGFKGGEGQTYTFLCPAKGTAHLIFGSDVYTGDSSICTAAVHSGIINLESGGIITLEFRPGRLIYGSTERNGITSKTFGEHYRSFIVRKKDQE